MSAAAYFMDGGQQPQSSGGYPGESGGQQHHGGGGGGGHAGVHYGDRLGGNGSAFNHSPHTDSEQHYDTLRQQARQAYDHGDHASGAQYNKQASEYIFRENNAPGRVAADTIDLHGQFVKEAISILEVRIDAARRQGEDHVHVIVGKGNHSVNHVAKIKPAVEELCTQQGLEWRMEHNEGRIFINLKGQGMGGMPPPGQVQPAYGGYQQQPQPHYGNQQQQHGDGHTGKPQQGFDEQEVKQAMGILRKCVKTCCTVM